MVGGIEHIYAKNLELKNLNWASDPLNTAIRLKTNMNRGGFLRHFYVRTCRFQTACRSCQSFIQLAVTALHPKALRELERFMPVMTEICRAIFNAEMDGRVGLSEFAWKPHFAKRPEPGQSN